MKTPEKPKEQFNWHKEVGGVGPDKQEARTKFYSKLGRLALQVETDAEKAEAMQKLEEKGFTTLHDLQKLPAFTEKIKQGSRFSLILDRYFKDTVRILQKNKRAKEVRLTLSLLTDQGLNVDSFDIGTKLTIQNGVLITEKANGTDRKEYQLRYSDASSAVTPIPLDLNVFESKEPTAPLLFTPDKPAKKVESPASEPVTITPETPKYQPEKAPEKPKTVTQSIVGDVVPETE